MKSICPIFWCMTTWWSFHFSFGTQVFFTYRSVSYGNCGADAIIDLVCVLLSSHEFLGLEILQASPCGVRSWHSTFPRKWRFLPWSCSVNGQHADSISPQCHADPVLNVRHELHWYHRDHTLGYQEVMVRQCSGLILWMGSLENVPANAILNRRSWTAGLCPTSTLYFLSSEGSEKSQQIMTLIDESDLVTNHFLPVFVPDSLKKTSRHRESKSHFLLQHFYEVVLDDPRRFPFCLQHSSWSRKTPPSDELVILMTWSSAIRMTSAWPFPDWFRHDRQHFSSHHLDSCLLHDIKTYRAKYADSTFGYFIWSLAQLHATELCPPQ